MLYSQQQYSNMTCFHDSFCICLDSNGCETLCNNGFCRDKELICSDNVNICKISCFNDNDCKNTKFYMASNEFHLNCIGSNSCNNINVNCGLPIDNRNIPGQLTISDFDDKMQICEIEAFFASSINNSSISCNGNIDNCHVDSKAATNDGIYDTEFECTLESGQCELNCESGCHKSTYVCNTNTTNDNNNDECKCNGCESGVNITSSNDVIDKIFEIFSTNYSMISTKVTSSVMIDIDTDTSDISDNQDDESTNFNLTDGKISNLEILYC